MEKQNEQENKERVKQNVYQRDTRFLNKDELIKDISEVNWQSSLKYEKNDPNFSFNTFEKVINKILNKHMPIKKMSKKELKTKSKPWITQGIKNSISRREKLYSKFIKSENKEAKDNYHQEYKELRNQIVEICRQSKNNHYQQYFLNNAHNTKKTWEAVRSIINIKTSKRSNINSLLVNNQVTNDPKEIADNFNTYFSSIASKLQSKIYNGFNFQQYLCDRNNRNFFISPTTQYEVSDIIKNLNSKKSVGPHSIPSIILKDIETVISKPLAEIINISFSSGLYIENLKLSKVIPVYKEKGDVLECSNYRPISLLANINKIVEKLMHSRLYSFLTISNCIYDLQFGFRKEHSTTHALIDLTEDIRETVDNNMFAIGVFVDLQKAFDTVDHTILLSKLDHYGIRGVANDWFKSYLRNRKQSVFINGKESYISTIEYGVPQGSVLGPLLFLIYINDLNNAIIYSTTRHFADDTSLLIKGKSLKQLKKHLNIDLKKLCKWLIANKISLNKEKTELIIFRNSRKKIDYKLKIKINGRKLYPSDNVKYLGIFLDSHLNWNKHCDYLATKLSRANGLLSKIRHYVARETIRKIYFALFSSIMSYASQIWGQTENRHIKRIVRLQNRAIRIINFAQYQSPKDILYKQSKILKFSDNVKVLNFLFAYDTIKGTVPSCLNNIFTLQNNVHSYLTRTSVQNQITLPRSHTDQYGIESIKFQTARTWNNYVNKLAKDNVINKSKAFCKYSITKILFDKY